MKYFLHSITEEPNDEIKIYVIVEFESVQGGSWFTTIGYQMSPHVPSYDNASDGEKESYTKQQFDQKEASRASKHVEQIAMVRQKKWEEFDEFIEEMVEQTIKDLKKSGHIDQNMKARAKTPGTPNIKTSVGDYNGKHKKVDGDELPKQN